MIMEYINTHTHTGLTGHGNGTIAEVVQAADEAGISILALTEHFPLSHEVDPDNFVSMPWDALDPYVHEIEAQRALHPTMQILVGTELEHRLEPLRYHLGLGPLSRHVAFRRS